MITILSMLASTGILKWFGIGAAAIGGLIAAWFHGKASAQPKVDAANAEAATAKQQAAQANADLTAVTTATAVREQVQQIPDDKLDAEGAALGIVRRD